MTTKIRFKGRAVFNAIFLFASTKSIQVPFPLKNVFDLTKLSKFKDK